MAKITINDKVIEAPEGANVLQVAKDNGISIAHYCYHEALPVVGVCRLCMVEVDNNPKPVPSCNLTVKEGMKVVTNSEKIKEIVRWGLQFHLINHPLDCPICDQAGECILQESYMQYGTYDSNMTEPKVHKKKVIDLGARIVLDKERCILCARCTRFTDHVTKTHELGIFNRGDRSEIGTYRDEPFDNPYSLNTVDVCPVGALTSKDFRFKQRVWFTTNHPSVCIKCSAGCNINVATNNKGSYRVTPRKNMQVNTWWMCDEGRTVYKWLNSETRYLTALQREADGLAQISTPDAVKELLTHISQMTWLISPQHTVEEYQALYQFFKVKKISDANIFLWYDHPEKLNNFDGLLLRGDKSPNSKGLETAAKENGFNFDVQKFKKSFLSHKHTRTIILAPENLDAHPSLKTLLTELPENSVFWLGSVRIPDKTLESAFAMVIPTKVFSEKNGTYINASGIAQKTKAFMKPNEHITDLIQIFKTDAK